MIRVDKVWCKKRLILTKGLDGRSETGTEETGKGRRSERKGWSWISKSLGYLSSPQRNARKRHCMRLPDSI